MGSDVTTEAIKQQIGKRIKKLGSRQLKLRAAGQDPKDVKVADLMPTKKTEGGRKFHLLHIIFPISHLHIAILSCYMKS